MRCSSSWFTKVFQRYSKGLHSVQHRGSDQLSLSDSCHFTQANPMSKQYRYLKKVTTGSFHIPFGSSFAVIHSYIAYSEKREQSIRPRTNQLIRYPCRDLLSQDEISKRPQETIDSAAPPLLTLRRLPQLHVTAQYAVQALTFSPSHPRLTFLPPVLIFRPFSVILIDWKWFQGHWQSLTMCSTHKTDGWNCRWPVTNTTDDNSDWICRRLAYLNKEVNEGQLRNTAGTPAEERIQWSQSSVCIPPTASHVIITALN